jgi:large repetitive protein
MNNYNLKCFYFKSKFLVFLLMGCFCSGAFATNNHLPPSLLSVSFTTNPQQENGVVTVCLGQSITYTDTSTNIGANPVYQWEFEGASSANSNQPGPHHVTYAAAGAYVTSLTINGVTATVNVVVLNVLTSTPVIEISPNTGWDVTSFNGLSYFRFCADGSSGALFVFSTNSTNTNSASQHIISWGDNSPNTVYVGQNIPETFHVYPSNGQFVIQYTIVLESGCTISKNFHVFIGSNPLATIINNGVPLLCNPGTVQYSIIPGAQNTSGTIYVFQTNDNSPPQVFTHEQVTSSGFVVTHFFNSISCGTNSTINNTLYPNSFQASVTVSNPCGSSSSAIGPINIQSKPVAAITPNPTNNQVCVNSTVVFTDTTEPGTNIGGSPTFNCTQDYKKYWKITGPSGDIISGFNGVVAPNPFVSVVGNMGFNSNNPNNPSVWTNTASNALSVTFLQPGIYSITIFAAGLNSCGITSSTRTICVNPELVADFSTNLLQGCASSTIQLTNLSSLPGCDNNHLYQWQIQPINTDQCNPTTSPLWSFTSGDATSFEPEITFTSPGVYQIQLTVSSQNQPFGLLCEPKSKAINVVISDRPVTSLTPSSICQDEVLQLNPITLNCYAAQPTNYLWDFGNHPSVVISNPTISSPTIFFTAPGTYTYTLTVENECGLNVYSNIVNVYPSVQVDASGPVATCINTMIPLNGSISGATNLGVWSASVVGGTFVSGANNLQTNYLPPTDYVGPIVFTLTTEDPDGPCTYKEDSFEVEVNSQATVFIGNYNSVCENGVVQLNASIGGAASSATWVSANGGTFSDPNSLNSTFTPPFGFLGTIELTLTTNDPEGPCESVSDSVLIEVVPKHQITLQPLAFQNICVGGNVPAFTVNYTGGEGTPSYQWFSNSTNSNTGGVAIAGATQASYIPPVFNTVGTFYYYAQVTLSGSGCGIAISEVAAVEVVSDPVIIQQAIATQTLCRNSVPNSLSVVVSGGIGTYTYQWYRNSVNSTIGGTLIPGATQASYIPSTSTLGTSYFYVEIGQSGVGCNVVSEVYQVVVVSLPSITTQTLFSSVCQGGSSAILTVSFINGVGLPSYQWYQNSINSNTGGTPIAGATNNNYSPPTNQTGTFFYYVVLNFTEGGCGQLTSSVAQVVVNPLPTIVTQPIASQTICVGGSIPALTVAYTGGVGTPSYQWFSNSTNSNQGGIPIIGATQASYIPPVYNSSGTFYYYAQITLSGSGCGSVLSNVATVDVVADPVVIEQAIPSQTWCQGSISSNLSVVVAGGIGAYTYQWYRNLVNSNTGGTLIPGATEASYLPSTADIGTSYYYVVIEQSGVGCNVTSATSELVVIAPPTFVTQPISSNVCEGGIPEALTVSFTNGIGNPTYQWYRNSVNSNSGGVLIQNATNSIYLPPSDEVGTYYYYVVLTFNEGGCNEIVSETAQVIVNPLATIQTHPWSYQDVCVGAAIAPLEVTFTGNLTNATYQWYSNTIQSNSGGTAITGATNPSFSPPPFEMVGVYYYYVVVTFNNSGCGSTVSSVATVEVIADPEIFIQPLNSQFLCQNSIPTNLSIAVTGGIGTYTYQWYRNLINSNQGGVAINGANESVYTPPTNSIGTFYYYCAVTQTGLGCSTNSSTFQVTVVLPPTITSFTQYGEVCFGAVSNPLTVIYSNGVGTPSYQWYSNSTNSNVGGIPINNANQSSFVPPSDQVGVQYYYVVLSFDQGGCLEVVSNVATIQTKPLAVIQNENIVVCSDSNFVFNPYTSSNIVPPSTLFTWSVSSVSPAGGVVGFTNQTNPMDQFSQSLINQTNQIVNITYLVTPISDNCTGNSFSLTVQVLPKPNVVFSTGQQVVCNQSLTNQVVLTSTTPGNTTFQWTALVPSEITGAVLSGTSTIPPQSLVNLSNVPQTITYQAVATLNENNLWCIGDVFTYTITVHPTLNSSGILSDYNGFNVGVFGGSNGFIDLTTVGGSGSYSYSWIGPNGFVATTEDVTNLIAGTYTVTITDGYCLPLVLSFTLTQPTELLAAADANLNINLLCFGDNNGAVGLLLTQQSVAPYTYALFNNNGNLIQFINSTYQINPQFFGLTAGTYYVVVTDINGATKTVSNLVVTQPQEISIQPIVTPVSCNGQNDASILLQVSGGVGPFQALWNNLATGLFQNNLSVGWYQIIVTDANGCSKSIEVEIPSLSTLNISPTIQQITCFGANNGGIQINLTGGIQPIQVVWSDGSNAGLVRNNLPPGSYTIWITDSRPCTIQRTFVISQPAQLQLTASVTQPLECLNASSGSIGLIVSGGVPPFTYQWSNGATTKDLFGLVAGTYSVVVTDSNACIANASFTLTRPNPLIVNVNQQTNANCALKTVSQIFTAVASGGLPPYTYQWSSGTVSGTNGQIMQTSTNGTVVLLVTDALGCTVNFTTNVQNPTIGNLNIGADSIGFSTYGIYSVNDPIQFISNISGDYQNVIWDFGDGTFSNELQPVHTYYLEKEYLVTLKVTYPFGCVYTLTLTLQVDKGYLLVIPTGFTPNKDGLNETIRPVAKRLKNLRMEIYDSWGALLYSENAEVIVGWNGKIKGIDAENGNYHMILYAETFDGRVVHEKQTFVLIK